MLDEMLSEMKMTPKDDGYAQAREGITALISPIPADPRFASVDMLWVAATAVGLVLVAVLLRGIPRLAGVGLLIAYGAYVALMMA